MTWIEMEQYPPTQGDQGERAREAMPNGEVQLSGRIRRAEGNSEVQWSVVKQEGVSKQEAGEYKRKIGKTKVARCGRRKQEGRKANSQEEKWKSKKPAKEGQKHDRRRKNRKVRGKSEKPAYKEQHPDHKKVCFTVAKL